MSGSIVDAEAQWVSLQHRNPVRQLGRLLKAKSAGERGVGCIDPPPLCSDLRGYCDLDAIGLGILTQGSRTVSTPALYWALTLLASTVGGSVNVRANAP